MDRKKLTKAIATLERQLEGQAIEFRDEELVVSLREYLDKAHKQLEAKSAEVVPKRGKGGAAAKAVVKKSRSVLFGAVMGAVVACWVFSGNYIFTSLFTLMVILGQLEYYRGVISTGVYPARKISVLGR